MVAAYRLVVTSIDIETDFNMILRNTYLQGGARLEQDYLSFPQKIDLLQIDEPEVDINILTSPRLNPAKSVGYINCK